MHYFIFLLNCMLLVKLDMFRAEVSIYSFAVFAYLYFVQNFYFLNCVLGLDFTL